MCPDSEGGADQAGDVCVRTVRGADMCVRTVRGGADQAGDGADMCPVILDPS